MMLHAYAQSAGGLWAVLVSDAPMTTGSRYGQAMLWVLFFLAAYPLWPYVVPLFAGAVLCMVGWRAQLRLERRLGVPRALAAGIHALVWLAVTAIPAWLIIQTVAANLGPLITKWQSGAPLLTLPPQVASTPLVGAWLARRLHDLNGKILLHYLSQHAGLIKDSLAHVWGLLLHTVVASLAVFSLGMRGERIGAEFDRIARSLWGARGGEVIAIAVRSARSVMVGLIGVGIIEGVLIGASYGLADMPLWTVWMVATMLLSAIPFGAAAILALAAGWLLLTGNVLAGLLVAIWGVAVIIAADLVLRPIVTGATTAVPFLLLLLSILGGARMFGLVGVIAGPFFLIIATGLWQAWFGEATT
ncbi:MAG: AI-2E family transporter [Gammaproteobacteria bacterium]|nr:AI-2E family transporter [Gammaproteobacteria bacterium]